MSACADKKKSSSEESSKVAKPAVIAGLDAVPSRADVIIGLEVPALAASPLIVRVLSRLVAADDSLHERLSGMLKACEIDPSVDLKSVLIALLPSKAGRDSLLIAEGNLKEAVITPCMGRHMAASGGQVESSVMDGRTIYHPFSSKDDPGVWFAFSGADTLLVASGRAVLADALGNGPKASLPDGAIVPLLQRLNMKSASIWGVMLMNEELAAGLAIASQGVIEKPSALVAEADLSAGLALRMELGFSTETDAKNMILQASKQREAAALTLQESGLGRLLGDLELGTNKRWASLRWQIDDEGLAELVGANFQGLGSTIDNDEPNDENPAP